MEPVNVIVGANGTGKTNLYRALQLLTHAAEGNLGRTLAEEGGIPSVLWAGQRRKGPVRMGVDIRFEDYTYHLELGLPPPGAVFKLDPEIKSEDLEHRPPRGRGVPLVKRQISTAMLRNDEGSWINHPVPLVTSESILSQVQDPHLYPEVSVIRERLLKWRFYHSFRTDPDSPIRRPRTGTLTPRLASDGSDLVCALKTIRGIGDSKGLDQAFEEAFPDSRLILYAEKEGRQEYRIQLMVPGINRPLEAQEFSDGTLRYLCLMAALLSPRPPELIALNEPETSLHPDLLKPLANLIAKASERTQVWLTTHSEPLAGYVAAAAGIEPIHLEKIEGETRARGRGLLE
jgi:predicted ATPase